MPKPTLQSEITLSKAQIDRIGELQRRYDASKPDRDELDSLKTKLRKQCESEPADLPVTVEGHLYTLQLSAREFVRQADPEITYQKLRKAVGAAQLWKFCKIALKVVDEFFSEDEQASFVSKERTGSRDIKAVLNEAA